MRKCLELSAVLVALLSLSGCWGDYITQAVNENPPSSNAIIGVINQCLQGIGACNPDPGSTFWGIYIDDYYDPDGYDLTTGSTDQFGPIPANNVGLAVAGNDPYAPALWNLYVSFANRCQGTNIEIPQALVYSNQNIRLNCTYNVMSNPPPTAAFSLYGSQPSTFPVVGTSGFFSTGNGMPQMTVFQQGVGSIATLNAISVSSDGSTATFPYPTQSNGNPLYAGFYSYTVVDGSGNIMPFHAFGIGNANTSQTTPYGITAFSEATWNSSCENDSWYGTYCSGGQGTKSDYAVNGDIRLAWASVLATCTPADYHAARHAHHGYLRI